MKKKQKICGSLGRQKKLSMLPKSNLYITLSILICFKHKKIVFSEFDDKDEDDEAKGR